MREKKVLFLPIERNSQIPPPIVDIFQKADDYGRKKRRHRDDLARTKAEILSDYAKFSQRERALFFSVLYDRFAESYDQHMSETGHYEAIRNVLMFAGPYIKLPLLDITAGTGEPLSHVCELIDASIVLRRLSMRELDAVASRLPDAGSGRIVANEISRRMRERAKEKLNVTFTSHDALDLPREWRFKTVLCSQTFHLITDEDKSRLVQSMHKVLLPGGTAIVIEEDPFRITETEAIEGISMFLEPIVAPIKHRGTLIAYFEDGGFKHLEQRGVYPIDSEHVMRLHLFQRR